MPARTTVAALVLLSSASALGAQTFGVVTESAQLTVPGLSSVEQLGADVALHGELALLGAPANGFFLSPGRAFVFTGAAGQWVQTSELSASDGSDFDQFGRSVALHGSTAVVGAPTHRANGLPYTGAAYVFERTGTTWTETTKLTANPPGAGDSFGFDVALDGDTLAVVAYGVISPSGCYGVVFVYVRSSGSWVQQAVLSHPGVEDWTFARVALQGDVLVVGAPFVDGGLLDSGAAYVFRRSGTVWSQEAFLTQPDKQPRDEFGTSVGLSGSTVVVGMPRDDILVPTNPNDETGSAYVFVRSGSQWSQQAKLTTSQTDLYRMLAGEVAVEGDRVLLAARQATTTHGYTGAVFAFSRSGTDWTETHRVEPSAIATAFGSSVAVDAGTLLVGASGGPRSYVLDVPGPVETYCVGKSSSLGCAPAIATLGRPAAGGGFELTARDALPDQPGLLLYGFRRAFQPFHGGRLCVGAPLRRALPIAQAQGTGTPPCTGVLRVGFSKRIASGTDPLLTVGQNVFAQWRQRDPQDPAGFGDALSDAVRFTIEQ